MSRDNNSQLPAQSPSAASDISITPIVLDRRNRAPAVDSHANNASTLFNIPVRGRQAESAVTGIEMRDGRVIMRAQCTQEEWKEWMRKSIAEDNYSTAPRNNGQ